MIANELAAVRAELPRVDAKCSTLAGLTMAGIAFLATQISHGPIVVRVLMAVAALVLAAATLILLMVVIRPIVSGPAGFGFRVYAGMQPAEVRELLADPAAAEERQEHSLVELSTITNRKYTGLRAAVDLTAVAVALTAAAILAGVLA